MKVEIVASIADRLNEAMQSRGMKQSQLVKLTGIDKGAISSYCSGRYEPKDDKIFIIAKALMVNPAWLAGFDVVMEEKKPPEKDGTAFLDGLTEEELQSVKNYVAFVKSQRNQ